MQWKTYTNVVSVVGYILLVTILPDMGHQITNSFAAGVVLGIPTWIGITFIEEREIGANNNPFLFIILLATTSTLGWAGGSYVGSQIWANGYAIVAMEFGIFLPCRAVYFLARRVQSWKEYKRKEEARV